MPSDVKRDDWLPFWLLCKDFSEKVVIRCATSFCTFSTAIYNLAQGLLSFSKLTGNIGELDKPCY